MLSVQTNMAAWNACRQFGINTKSTAKRSKKLSSGYQINRAADDAAGLAISEKMRRQIRGLHQGAENIQDGIGYVQTADGALNEAQDILQRINELAVKSANGTNTADDRMYIDQEVQALKKELDRIFDTTSFNEIRIWEPKQKKVLAYDKRQAVEFSNTSRSMDVTNANCGVIACGSYKINADKDTGVYIGWTGYDGQAYRTTTISWDELKQKNYKIEMSDYFGDKTNNKLYDVNGNAVFKHQISIAPQSAATIDDIVKCINGKTFSSLTYAYTYGRFEDNGGNPVGIPNVTILENSTTSDSSYIRLNYAAVYASNHNTGNDSSQSVNVFDFDAADDAYLAPANSSGTLVQTQAGGGNLTSIPGACGNLDAARDSQETWSFSFYMDGIGAVTATSNKISYYAPSDTADDDYKKWWDWQGAYVNGKYVEHYTRKAMVITSSEKGSGTLGSAMQALTGDKNSATPGLLTEANSGAADGGGYLQLHFALTAKDDYEYGNGLKSKDVGSFKIKIKVDAGDTEQSVLDKINAALNANTIVDFYTASGSSSFASNTIGTAYATRHSIDIPIYGGTCGLFVQAGAEAGRHINVQYDSLSVLSMGLEDTNVKTVKASDEAIEAVREGLRIISDQRATFGAYQNRLEHAYNINLNTEENTQSAESAIRDTDMAKLMVEYANANIVGQAGASMLSQANQQPDYILQLLQ